MFNFSKIANELISSWDCFLGEYKVVFFNNTNLLTFKPTNQLFNKGFYDKLSKINFKISYEDFIYLGCLYQNDFQTSLQEQKDSGHLSEEYVKSQKPNEFVIKLFKYLKEFIYNKDLKFIQQHIVELGIIYYFLNFAILKIKLVSKKLNIEDFKKLDKERKIKLVIYRIIRDNKDKVNKFNNILFKMVDLNNKLKSFKDTAEKFNNDKESLVSNKYIKNIFGSFLRNYNNKFYENIKSDLINIKGFIENFIDNSNNNFFNKDIAYKNKLHIKQAKEILIETKHVINLIETIEASDLKISWTRFLRGFISNEMKEIFFDNKDVTSKLNKIQPGHLEPLLDNNTYFTLENMLYNLFQMNPNEIELDL